MSEMNNSEKPNPTALGLFGLTVACSVFGFHVLSQFPAGLDWVSSIWINLFGGVLLLICGIAEFSRNKTLGGTAFFLYGFFWLSIGLSTNSSLLPYVTLEGNKGLAVGYISFFFISFFFLFGFAFVNKILSIIFLLINIAALLLGISYMVPSLPVSWCGGLVLIAGAACFYGAAGYIINEKAGREIFPLGKPIFGSGK